MVKYNPLHIPSYLESRKTRFFPVIIVLATSDRLETNILLEKLRCSRLGRIRLWWRPLRLQLPAIIIVPPSQRPRDCCYVLRFLVVIHTPIADPSSAFHCLPCTQSSPRPWSAGSLVCGDNKLTQQKPMLGLHSHR